MEEKSGNAASLLSRPSRHLWKQGDETELVTGLKLPLKPNVLPSTSKTSDQLTDLTRQE